MRPLRLLARVTHKCINIDTIFSHQPDKLFTLFSIELTGREDKGVPILKITPYPGVPTKANKVVFVPLDEFKELVNG